MMFATWIHKPVSNNELLPPEEFVREQGISIESVFAFGEPVRFFGKLSDMPSGVADWDFVEVSDAAAFIHQHFVPVIGGQTAEQLISQLIG